jgi:ubiquinone/menaquinone biosynthesis C-methylase UbiE
MSNYNKWHESRSKDDDILTPWHLFVKENLQDQDILDRVILEIGCGRGGFSNYLAQRVPSAKKIIAADYSDAAITIAKEKYKSSQIDWRQQNIMAIDFTDNYFDTIVSCETIEHVTDPRKALFELYRVLKPGGTLFLTCPSYFNLFGVWCLYRWMIGKPFAEGGQPYVNYILFPVIYYWLKRIGFKVSSVKSSEITIPARVPKHFWTSESPYLLRPFGYRTFYILKKD